MVSAARTPGTVPPKKLQEGAEEGLTGTKADASQFEWKELKLVKWARHNIGQNR